jgi:MFS family permease
MNIAASVFGMLMTLTMSSLCVFTIAVLGPAAAVDLDLDAKFVGPFMSVVYLLAALTGTVTGHMIHRLGAIRVCQLTTVSCACGLFAFATMSWPMLILSAILLGCAYGPFNPASAHVLGGLATARWQPLIFSVKQLGVPLGGMLAGIIAPLLLLSLGWRWAAVVLGVLALLPVLLLQPLRAQFDRVDDVRPSTCGVRGALSLALGEVRLRRYTIVAFAYTGCQICAGTFMVVFLLDSTAMSVLDAGYVLAMMQGVGVLGRLAWGSVAGQLIPTRVVLALIGMCSAAALVLVSQINAQWSYPQILLAAGALGMSSLGWNGILLSQVATLAPPGRSADATGGMQFVMFGGVVLLPSLFALLVRATGGYQTPFIALAVLAVVGALVVLGVAGKRDALLTRER